MTGQVITAAAVIAAAAGGSWLGVSATLPWMIRAQRTAPTRLGRLLAEHETDEALRRADMEAIVDATREPPPMSDRHAGRLLHLVLSCPACESRLEDSVGGWLCVTCDQTYSAAEIEATP